MKQCGTGSSRQIALDAIALMDALKIEKAVMGGFDWEHALLTSWRRCGQSAAKGWFR